MTTDTPDSTRDPLRGVRLRALLGPTAVGKSALALDVAERSGAEIVSLDSMLVYRGMDVGTAKPSVAERARVRHHMIDLVETDERYDVQRYLKDLAPVLDDARERGVPIVFTGGTGFYLKILVEGLFEGPDVDADLRESLMRRAHDEGNEALHAELARVDPRSAARIHANDTKRVVRGLEVYLQTGRALSDWQTQWGVTDAARGVSTRRLVGLDAPVDELDRRIRRRARAMFDAGWADEAAAVRAGRGFGSTSIQALGYADALDVYDGRRSVEEAVDAVARATRQFARRQRTWYRKFHDIAWFPALPFVATSHPADDGTAGSNDRAEHGMLVASALRALDLVG